MHECGPQDMESNQKGIEVREKIAGKMANIKHKIAVISGKGGVGKTTVAVNLSVNLIMQGHKVGLLDVDIHGPNVPKMLAIEEEKIQVSNEGIVPAVLPIGQGLKVMSMAFMIEKDSPVIWRGMLKMQVIDQFLGDVVWGELDYLIIDLPPGTGDEPLSIAQQIPDCDGAIVVTTPQDVALLDSRKAVEFLKLLKIPVIGVIENMSGLTCPHCDKEIDLFKVGGGEKAALAQNVPYLGRVPFDSKIVEFGDEGKPFMIGDSETDAAKAFEEIVVKIKKFVERDVR